MRTFLAWIVLFILCGCGGGGGGQTSSGGGSSSPTQMSQLPDVSLVRVELSPASTTLAAGFSTDLQLFAVYSNGIRLEVTAQATFTSSNPGSITLSGSRASAALVGTSTVIGQYQGQSASAIFQVTAATLRSLRVDPPLSPWPRAPIINLASGFTDAAIDSCGIPY